MTDNSPATDEEIAYYERVYEKTTNPHMYRLIARIRAETAKNSGEVVAWRERAERILANYDRTAQNQKDGGTEINLINLANSGDLALQLLRSMLASQQDAEEITPNSEVMGNNLYPGPPLTIPANSRAPLKMLVANERLKEQILNDPDVEVEAGVLHFEASANSPAKNSGEVRVPIGWKLVPLDPTDSGSTMGDAYLAGYEDGLEEAAALATPDSPAKNSGEPVAREFPHDLTFKAISAAVKSRSAVHISVKAFKEEWNRLATPANSRAEAIGAARHWIANNMYEGDMNAVAIVNALSALLQQEGE